jgi:hypothetical protein
MVYFVGPPNINFILVWSYYFHFSSCNFLIILLSLDPLSTTDTN